MLKSGNVRYIDGLLWDLLVDTMMGNAKHLTVQGSGSPTVSWGLLPGLY